ncbi:MAG: excisionase family DNA-binding protein [Bifidobacteriaceae bacterium]|jgi:excisionase family DNA binding protein|nr:excisionase family DNA-binding protein [Bifidobacteriaceae bacterium]
MTRAERSRFPVTVSEALTAVLASDNAEGGGRELFVSPGTSAELVELPPELADLLRQAAQAMREGVDVAVVPTSRRLTTTQAAHLLGVTRPTVVKLLDAGVIPHSKVGTHRRVALPDALNYRDRLRSSRYHFIAETQADLGDEAPTGQTLADLKAIRRELHATRAEGGHG